MTSRKISQLPGATALSGTEVLVGLQGGVDVAVTAAQIGDYLAPAATYDTLAAFQATKPRKGALVTVRAVTGTYPPAAGLDATPLTYRPVSSTTGLFGEITVNGQLYAPIYSTHPVKVGEFGVIGDCAYAELGTSILLGTANGTSTITMTSTSGIVVGMNVANPSWHSFAAAAIASAGVIPAGTTVISITPNTSIVVSNSIVAASNVQLVFWSEHMTGTDNTVAIQAAIDFAMRNSYSAIHWPNGQYMISDTLQAGWGNTFYELHLQGGIRAPYGGKAGGGAALYMSVVDRPVISVQSARSTTIKGLAIIGRNRTFSQYAQGFSNILSSDPLDWLDPRFQPSGNNSGGIQTTAPHAAITIDAFSAAQPTIHYPARTFPAWTGLSLNYSASYPESSEVLVEDCDIEGFGVLIASGLVTNTQGDFLKMHRLIMLGYVYGVSIGNTQSRNVEFRNIDYARGHTLFSGSNLGQASGEIVGPIDNVGGGDAYQTFDFQNMGFAGPLLISGHYFENQVRLGNFVASAAFSAPVIFTGGLWEFQNGNTNFNLNPSSLITSGINGVIYLNGITMNGGPRISNLISGGGSLYINGGAWAGAFQSNANASQLIGINYTGGFFFGDVRFNSVLRDNLSVKNLIAASFTAISGGLASMVLDDEVNFRNSNIGIQTRVGMTQCAKNYTDTFGRRWRMTIPPEIATGIGSFSAAPSYSNDTVTFSWPNANQTAGLMFKIVPGNFLYHISTATLFLVTAVGAPSGGNVAVTTTQQNNLVVDGTNTFVKNVNPDPTLASGNIVIVKTEAVIPSVLEYGTFSSSGTTVSTISDGSGTSHMANNYVNADVFFGLTIPSVPYRQWPIGLGMTISGVSDGTPGSLSLSANALVSGTFPIFPYELY